MKRKTLVRKSPATIRRELVRLAKLLDDKTLSLTAASEAYGAQQALAWVRGEDVMAPAKAAAGAKD
jgi:hypothetical protein